MTNTKENTTVISFPNGGPAKVKPSGPTSSGVQRVLKQITDEGEGIECLVVGMKVNGEFYTLVDDKTTAWDYAAALHMMANTDPFEDDDDE